MKQNGAARSLQNPNFRLYLVGQGFSQIGMWFQLTAEMWAIVELTGSGVAVGLHSVLRFGPLLLFGIPGSLFSGRFNRRKFFITTQCLYGVAALTLAIAAFVWSVNLQLIYTVVFIQGFINVFDNPVRRSFVRDMVSDDELPNALSLNSSMEVLTRTIGPAIGGVLVVAIGAPWCFLFNAISFTAVITSLTLMDTSKLRPDHRLGSEPGQLRAGFRYAWDNRRIRRTLVMSVVVFVFAWNWQVILPVYASRVLGGDADVYGLLVGLLGVGAFIGTLVVARVHAITGRYFRVVCTLLTTALLITALAPSLPFAIAGLALLGATGTAFQIGAQTRLQLESDDAMIGRIFALYAVTSVGAKPLSGLLAGTVIDAGSPRLAFGVGAAAVGALATYLIISRAARAAAVDKPAVQKPSDTSVDPAAVEIV